MTTPLEKLLTNLEQITEYYKLHEQNAEYEDLRKVLDEYYESIETPGYDFEKRWSELSPKTKAKFWKKIKQIENDAIERISKEDKVSCEKIREVITPLDPESEWDSLYGEEGMPKDYTWVEFEMQFMRGELRGKGVI